MRTQRTASQGSTTLGECLKLDTYLIRFENPASQFRTETNLRYNSGISSDRLTKSAMYYNNDMWMLSTGLGI